MARKRYKPEEIVAKLRQVDVLVSQGQNMVDAIRQIGVSEVTYYRWRQEFGGLKTEQVKHLQDLELDLAEDDLVGDRHLEQPGAAVDVMDDVHHLEHDARPLLVGAATRCDEKKITCG